MVVVLGLLALAIIIFGFRKVDELPTIGAGAILAGFIILSGAIGWGASGDGCYVDWDGRSNSTICD